MEDDLRWLLKLWGRYDKIDETKLKEVYLVYKLMKIMDNIYNGYNIPLESVPESVMKCLLKIISRKTTLQRSFIGFKKILKNFDEYRKYVYLITAKMGDSPLEFVYDLYDILRALSNGRSKRLQKMYEKTLNILYEDLKRSLRDIIDQNLLFTLERIEAKDIRMAMAILFNSIHAVLGYMQYNTDGRFIGKHIEILGIKVPRAYIKVYFNRALSDFIEEYREIEEGYLEGSMANIFSVVFGDTTRDPRKYKDIIKKKLPKIVRKLIEDWRKRKYEEKIDRLYSYT